MWVEFPITQVPTVPRPTLARLAGALRPSRRKADVPDTDHELLARFTAGRDEAAFRALVNRHANTVLSACRQVLTDPADIDDAFQAVFLVLLKKAKAVDATTPLGGWLYAVAHRLAVRCRSDKARRSAREAEAATRAATERAATARERTASDLSWKEATAALHAELNALPDKYRLPLLLCYLHGLTRDEAAEQLGTTVGAIRGQLERGRALLERRLTKRGLVLSAGLLAVVMGGSAVAGGPPAALIDLAVGVAHGNASSTVAALAHGAFPMTTTLKQVILPVLLVLGLLGGIGAGLRSPVANADEKPAVEMKKPKADAKPDAKPAEVRERTISGTVVDADGKPVVAELSLVWFEGQPQPLGKANADGTFKVTVPMKRGEYGGWLVAKAPGHGVDFLTHAVDYLPATRTPTAEVTLKLPEERPMKGRVIDQQGKPVAGAKVVALNIAAFDSDASRDGHFKRWATETYQRGTPPQGDRSMEFADGHQTPFGKFLASPYSAKTDADGRFEIAGLGANHLVSLLVHGTGVADKYLNALNRDGFDPAPVNKAAKDHEQKGYSFGGKWVLYGPDPTIVLEPEKIVRGTVTDADGKPRAGVNVVFSRTSKRDLNRDYNQAKTDQDGKYEIRGARKHREYGVEVDSDPSAGLLECQGFADDTVGYEPVVIDIKQAKGVVVTGRVTDKATGKPIVAQMWADVLADNAFVVKYPPFLHSASMSNENNQTDADGKFRIVTIPGPVILMASPKGHGGEYKPAVPDPKHPDRFHARFGGLGFYGYDGAWGTVQGNWCKVIEAKAADTELSVNVEFEPATRTPLKVTDADGKPLTGTHAAGTTHRDFAHPVEAVTATHTIFNLEPKADRLVAVVHKEKKWVGTAVLTAESKDPVVKLGAGGSVTGRAVGTDGKPIPNANVTVHFARRAAQEAFAVLTDKQFPTTNEKGEFRVDDLFPGEEFKLLFAQGQKRFGPDYDKAPKHTVEKHGETLKLGDVKLEPAKEE